MNPSRYLIVLTLSCFFIATCSVIDDSSIITPTKEDTITSATQIVEISKATKLINILALQEVLKNENFAGNYFTTKSDTEVRTSACPNISPDPSNYDPLVPTEYNLEFDLCAFSDQLIGVGGTPLIVGTVNISMQGRLGNSGCKFRIYGKDLSIGAVQYLNYDITQIHNRQITSDICIKRDIIDFATIIDKLEFSVSGLSEFGESNDILNVLSASNARTRYRDYGCDTDINDFLTIIDDKIVIQADTLISGFMDNENTFTRNIYTDVAAEFDLICPCPISQSFNIIRDGVTTLTCFDFDDEVCDDDLTCLTTVIPLDCRY